MISPRRVIKGSDDSYLIAVSKTVGISSEKLFFKLESIKTNGEINGFSVTKEKSDGNFSYVIKSTKGEVIRIVCAF